MPPGGSSGRRRGSNRRKLWSERLSQDPQPRADGDGQPHGDGQSRGEARGARGRTPAWLQAARGAIVPRRIPARDAGMTTAEYALGTVAACGFAAVLWAVVHSGAVHHLIQSVVERALNLPF
ncbi:MAG: DUF4244 domain-containing protein [Frankiaceae bacterium]